MGDADSPLVWAALGCFGRDAHRLKIGLGTLKQTLWPNKRPTRLKEREKHVPSPSHGLFDSRSGCRCVDGLAGRLRAGGDGMTEVHA